MLKDLPITNPVKTFKKPRINWTTISVLVTSLVFLSLIALFAHARQDLVWGVFHQSDIELVQMARAEVNKSADVQLSEAVSHVFIKE